MFFSKPSFLRKRRLAVVLFGGMTVMTALAVGHSSSFKPVSYPTTNRLGSVGVPVKVRQAPEKTNTEVIDIYVTPSGFDPEEITVPKGPVLLTIHNGTGRGELPGYALKRPDGAQSAFDATQGGNPSVILELNPGTFAVADTKNPKLGECKVIVTP